VTGALGTARCRCCADRSRRPRPRCWSSRSKNRSNAATPSSRASGAPRQKVGSQTETEVPLHVLASDPGTRRVNRSGFSSTIGGPHREQRQHRSGRGGGNTTEARLSTLTVRCCHWTGDSRRSVSSSTPDDAAYGSLITPLEFRRDAAATTPIALAIICPVVITPPAKISTAIVVQRSRVERFRSRAT